jgi:hypothetical protein
MRVFAEYLNDEKEISFRRRTLLCFGDSTRVIGSAVLMNPGSSKPIEGDPSGFVRSFYSENHKAIEIDFSIWREFSVDSTMLQLKKIFNGWYVNNEEIKQLNGVIQLFNCHYFMDPNADKAQDQFKKNPSYVFNEYDEFKETPVYLGWGGAGRTGVLHPIAAKIFENYSGPSKKVYNESFLDNNFYHPGYVNRSYKSNQNTINFNQSFYKLVQ